MKKVVVIHTSLAIYQSIDEQLKKMIPDVDIHNLIDMQMLNDVVNAGGMTVEVINRMCKLVDIAKDMKPDLILNACSSVGEAFDIARQQTDIPTLRIDEPMAELAVNAGSRIAVYGTVATTLLPSCRLIEKTAKALGRDVEVTPYLIDGAFYVLSEEKNVEKHNKMVMDKILETEARHDVIVLAQASMTVLVPLLGDLKQPIMYSLVSGVDRAKQLVEK